jgi:hypothetical protein
MYLYLILSTRALVSAFRVQLSANRGRSVVVALASLMVGASPRWTLRTCRLATSSNPIHPPSL